MKLINFFEENSVNAIYLSDITEIEFSSAVWKKCRKKELTEDVARFFTADNLLAGVAQNEGFKMVV